MYKMSCLCGVMFKDKYLDLYTHLYSSDSVGYLYTATRRLCVPANTKLYHRNLLL